MNNSQFAKIIDCTENNIRYFLKKGINPAVHYSDRLRALEMPQEERLLWLEFFEPKAAANRPKTTAALKKRGRRIRSIPVKEPLNLILTPEQTTQINQMTELIRNRVNFIFLVLNEANKKGIIDATPSNKELNKLLSKMNNRTDEKLSPRRFQEIVLKIRNSGLQKFIDDWAQSGKGRTGKTIINEDDYQAFKKIYMNGSQHSIEECWKYALNGRNPQEFPHAKTFEYQVIKREGIPAIDYARNGQEFASRRWGASVPRKSVALPCENWIGDAMLFDSLVVGSSGKQTRLWFTAWMDEKSKRFVGYEIHEEGQKTEHILMALYNGISKYRAPKSIIVDNGKTYRSKAFSGGRPILKITEEESLEMNKRISSCSELNIAVNFTKPYNHHGKDIEREFSRLHRGFCRWFATYFGVNVERHSDLFRKIQTKNGKEEYMPTITQFKEAFTRYLTEIQDIYTYESGENKGKNPITIWNNGYAEYCNANSQISDTSLILLCARRTEQKTLRGNGILDNKTNTWYYDDWIIGNLGEKVFLRVPPMDNTKVYCYGEKDNFLGVLYAQERIAKLIKFPEEKHKLTKQMERVNKVNKSIKKEFKTSLKDIEIVPEEAFERIAASNKAIAQSKGLDTTEKIIEGNNISINKFDRDLAEAKRQEEFGKQEMFFAKNTQFQNIDPLGFDYEEIQYA